MRDAQADSVADAPSNALLEGLPPDNSALALPRPGLRRRGKRRFPPRFFVMALAVTLVGAWAAVVALASATGPLTWTAPGLLAANTLVAASATGYSLNDVSCSASGPLCVAVDQRTAALSTNDPSGDPNAWRPAVIEAAQPPMLFREFRISCPSALLCVAVDSLGNVITSTHPTGDAAAWRAANIDGTHVLMGVSCASESLCVAVDDAGNAITSTTPTDPASWSPASIDAANPPLTGVSCPSAALCAAVDHFGNAVVSTAPTAGAGAWNPLVIDPAHVLRDISCPSASLCVAVDDAGNAITSTNPTGGVATWTIASVDGPHTLNRVSCPTMSFCVAVDRDGNAITSTNPTGGAGAWQATSIDGTRDIAGVSCASASLCLAVDRSGFALVGTSTDTTQALTVSLGGSGGGTVAGAGVSCPSTCTATYRKGTVVALSAAPAAGSTFAGWGGACSGTGVCSPTLSSAQTVTATFTANPPPARVLLVSVGGLGEGVVAGAGITCPPTCSAHYAAGTVVTLTATPRAPSTFSGWNGACSGAGRCSVTISSDQTVQATFTRPGAPTATIGRAVRSKHGHLVTLTFHAAGTVSGFHCALVRPAVPKRAPKGSRTRAAQPKPRFSSCRSPKRYRNLPAGGYAFYVQASGPGGTGPSARRAFKVP